MQTPERKKGASHKYQKGIPCSTLSSEKYLLLKRTERVV
jgi:hypothetical protein